MQGWVAKVVAGWHAVQTAASRFARRKVKSTPFGTKNGGAPYNASGVAQVGPRRFVFVDNHDPSALFEFVLSPDGAGVEWIRRRRLVGISAGALRDPEGLARVDLDGEVFLVAASSLCVAGLHGQSVNDGLVRVRYAPDGDLQAEAMPGFRAWLLANVPTLAAVGKREPDAGGLNIEGIAWDPRAGALLFGQRGPTNRGHITVIRVPVDAGRAPWTTASLRAPSILRARVPKSNAAQGIRDISYDAQMGDFLILLGRSTSQGDEPFQLCTWDGSSDEVRLLDVTFHRSMKPEGVTTFSPDLGILVVDDGGGYAVVDGRAAQ